MNSKVVINPLIAIEENCAMLKEAGANKGAINFFILESLSELELEVRENMHVIAEEGGVADFFSQFGKVASRGFSILGDSIKEKIVGFILDQFGIADGWIKEVIIKFIGNLTIRECIQLAKGDLSCDIIMTKSAQTLAEVVVEQYLIKPLVKEPTGATNPASFGADKSSQIGELFRSILRNAFSGSDIETSPLALMLRPHMKPICGVFDDAAQSIKSAIMQENLYKELVEINLNNKPLKESFQKRMKVRLKKGMKTLLDGGRKDLVKHGKPWNKGRQSYSNAFVAKEVSSVAAGLQGAPASVAPRGKKKRGENKK